MEDIEYLEEYENIVKPSFNSTLLTSAERNKMATLHDDDDSSIDQDMFESLFNDHSDESTQENEDLKLRRRDDRESVDSFDMLLRDFGEQLTEGELEKKKAGSVCTNKTKNKATPSKGSGTTPKVVISGTSVNKSDAISPGKAKSIATVRPTVQNQFTEPKSLIRRSIITNNRSESKIVGPTTSKISKSGVNLHSSTISRPIIKSATMTGAVSKKPHAPTIIRPEKHQSKDPAEDPLSFDSLDAFDSDSDSFTLSDISDEDSIGSLSDWDEEEEKELELLNSNRRKNEAKKIISTKPAAVVADAIKSQKSLGLTLKSKNCTQSNVKTSEKATSNTSLTSVKLDCTSHKLKDKLEISHCLSTAVEKADIVSTEKDNAKKITNEENTENCSTVSGGKSSSKKSASTDKELSASNINVGVKCNEKATKHIHTIPKTSLLSKETTESANSEQNTTALQVRSDKVYESNLDDLKTKEVNVPKKKADQKKVCFDLRTEVIAERKMSMSNDKQQDCGANQKLNDHEPVTKHTESETSVIKLKPTLSSRNPPEINESFDGKQHDYNNASTTKKGNAEEMASTSLTEKDKSEKSDQTINKQSNDHVETNSAKPKTICDTVADDPVNDKISEVSQRGLCGDLKCLEDNTVHRNQQGQEENIDCRPIKRRKTKATINVEAANITGDTCRRSSRKLSTSFSKSEEDGHNSSVHRIKGVMDKGAESVAKAAQDGCDLPPQLLNDTTREIMKKRTGYLSSNRSLERNRKSLPSVEQRAETLEALTKIIKAGPRRNINPSSSEELSQNSRKIFKKTDDQFSIVDKKVQASQDKVHDNSSTDKPKVSSISKGTTKKRKNEVNMQKDDNLKKDELNNGTASKPIRQSDEFDKLIKKQKLDTIQRKSPRLRVEENMEPEKAAAELERSTEIHNVPPETSSMQTKISGNQKLPKIEVRRNLLQSTSSENNPLCVVPTETPELKTSSLENSPIPDNLKSHTKASMMASSARRKVGLSLNKGRGLEPLNILKTKLRNPERKLSLEKNLTEANEKSDNDKSLPNIGAPEDIFKQPQTYKSFLTNKKPLESKQSTSINYLKNFKIREVRVRLNRNVVAAYFKNLQLEKQKLATILCTPNSSSSVRPGRKGTTNTKRKLSVTVSNRNAIIETDVQVPKSCSDVTPTGRKKYGKLPKNKSVSSVDDTQRIVSRTNTVANAFTISPPSLQPQLMPTNGPSQSVGDVEGKYSAGVKPAAAPKPKVRAGKTRKSAPSKMPQTQSIIKNTRKRSRERTDVEPKLEDEDRTSTVSQLPSVVPIPAINTSTFDRLSNSTTNASPNAPLTVMDSSGTRIYSFLYPAEKNKKHESVLLDYCCPNLDGPMPAIDPTRIHEKTQKACQELPAFIVMTTKVITRAELEANADSIPASIRQKVQKIKASGNSLLGTSNNVPAPPQSTTPSLSGSTVSKTISSPLFSTSSASNAGTIPNETVPCLATPNTPAPDFQESQLRYNLRRFDATLKKYCQSFIDISFTDRQETIESMISTIKFTPKDIENAVRLLDEYGKQLYSVSSSSTKSKTNQSENTPNATTKQLKRSSSKASLSKKVPIYDDDKNIIGYQLQVPQTTTCVAKPLQSGRSKSDSALTTPNSTESWSKGVAISPAVLANKLPVQDTPRIFYTNASKKTSPKDAMLLTVNKEQTAELTSNIKKVTTRLGKHITIRPVVLPSAPQAEVASSMKSSVTATPTATHNRSHLKVATTTQNSSVATSKRPKRKTAISTKVIVVSDATNRSSLVDECILPDDNTAEIKREKDDDFIG